MTQPDIQIKERPNPQKAHRIEMVIENAPGPFAVIEGAANYSVKNHFECGHIDPVPGIASRITTHPAIEWKPIGEGRYEAIVYEDLIMDEDYYGRGLCRWELVSASAMLKATGAEGETKFLPAISAQRINASSSLRLNFWAGFYPRAKSDDYPDYGEEDISTVSGEQKVEFFAIRMKAEAVSL
ncbi:MAG: hypothetical protein E6Q50_15080 [Lysobacter sp.]|nr:MAG: hypothetical protein E6Q50_15080 [Lysobacter sp.]